MSTDKKNDKLIDSYDYLGNAASAMDCTGLIPAGPVTDAERSAYEEVYRFGAPKVKKMDLDDERSKK